jgi:DNA-binding MarR family transcriptional regulator
MRNNFGGYLMNDKYATLRLKNQLCFPLYAVSNMITRKYKPLLDKIDLTYTQYIVMMVLWEEKKVNEKFLCEALCLKSNTITPLLKKLEGKGYITKGKNKEDERNLIITLTKTGEDLKDNALCVPECIAKEFDLTQEEAALLYKILYKMLDAEKEKENAQ